MRSEDKKVYGAMYKALTRHTQAVERQSDLLAAQRMRERQEAAGLPRPFEPLGARGDLKPLGSPLSFCLSIPGFAQEATRIPAVETRTGAAGVTPEGQVVCACGGGVTDLPAGNSFADCTAGCGRVFVGTADKAFSFGPWPEEEAEAA